MGYTPSRQGFGGPQQQQGGFGGFGGPQQQQGGFGGFGGPQQQQGGFGGYGMPQQFGGFGGFGGYGMPQQQGFGGYGMPQQQGFGGYDLASLLRGGSQSAAPQPLMQQGLASVGMQPQNQAMQPQRMPTPLSPDYTQRREQMIAAFRQGVNPYNSGEHNQQARPRGSFMQSLGTLGIQPRMPQAPTTQQVGQEDPRMQAMRVMQRMNFGGGGGYEF